MPSPPAFLGGILMIEIKEPRPLTHYMPYRTAGEYNKRARHHERNRPADNDWINVGNMERKASLAAGATLALLGLSRRNLPGLAIAAIGGGLLYRGATGHCYGYQAVGIDTADEAEKRRATEGFHVVHSTNINKSPEELYAYWRKLDNLPSIMSHVESVCVLDDRRSHWTATAPVVIGGSVEWDAEITEDVPNERIAWQSLPEADVDNRGVVEFKRLPGDRGTAVRVEIEYSPPAGRVGKWVAKLFGEAPDQQIREDLRAFKRTMEVGEVLSVEGQPHGSCAGLGRLRRS
jgi:uncharacterized membrane protein